ncbi:hypothetical protein G6F22_012628 [Rhizopus arrhizus]|nr:hypothetical protein G6F22_012628 [Rhizopus arrhizus]KAG0959007.1 hypothetical protein G6F31_012084 [Rhizopus arrhizus]KAG1272803.1 hypothetical protein G6F65_011452 [Rhizopus arrhizus]
MSSTPVGAACGCRHWCAGGLWGRMRGPRRPQGVALISSTVIHRSADTGAEVQVLDTTFKGKHVFIAWGLRGPELTRSADPATTVAARNALHAVAGHSEGPRSPEVFIANQSAVAITVYRLLTEARSGDAIFFLCDSQAVVDWLITALEVQGAD